MKTKLLRKVRKRFDIYYFKNGVEYMGDKYKEKFLLKDYWNEWNYCIGNKNECLNKILSIVRYEYKKYSRKNKQNKPIKVWWNG